MTAHARSAAQPPKAAVLAVAFVSIAMLGWLDFLTGRQVAFSLFYLVPIVACGWWVGRWAAVGGAFFAAGVWFVADYQGLPPPHLLHSAWNGFSLLTIFLAFGVLAALLRADRGRLATLLERESALARTDDLTGLANSREFLDALGVELARARRGGHAVCMAYIDLDNFKLVNDRYGHAAGDEALMRVAQVVRSVLRGTDVAARLGGDEFGVLLWDMSPADGERWARRVTSRVREVGADYPTTNLGATAGVVYFQKPPIDLSTVLREADAAMYAGKAAGKGAIVLRTFD